VRFWTPDYRTLLPFLAGMAIGLIPSSDGWVKAAFLIVGVVLLVWTKIMRLPEKRGD